MADASGSPAMSRCLANPVILREIMQHFSTAQLLKLSLVNKDWNGAARCVMRKQDNLIANLKSEHPCRTLAAFASDLQKMNVVPFSGMRIYLNSSHSLCPYSSPDAFDAIFDRLQFKYFHVATLGHFYATFKGNCPGYLFVRKILQVCGRELEELVISPSFDGGYLQRFFQHCSFPNLKIFSFTEYTDEEEDNLELVRTVVSKAPNLQELHSWWYFLLMEEALQGSSALLVNHVNYNPLCQPPSARPLGLLRLKKLKLDHIRDWSVTRFNRIIPQLLQPSHAALNSLCIHLTFALPIMCYEICLENVTVLKLYMDCRPEKLELVRPCFSILKNAFDFTRIFPRLEAVDVHNVVSDLDLTSGQIREFVGQANAHASSLRTPLPDRAANITKLFLYDCLKEKTATFLSRLFRNVDKLSVMICEELEMTCGLIWEHWVDLEQLEIERTGRSRNTPEIPCLDSVFCGIFSQEVEELGLMDDEYLKCVNIVPVMPSFTCLKRLRKFHFLYSGWSDLPPFISTDPKFIFTQVTGWTAFARCPNLSVTLET